MKLPNFHESELSKMRNSNNISLGKYRGKLNWIIGTMDENLLELRENGYFIIKDESDIQISKDKTLNYLGDKVVVYIYNYASNYYRFGKKPSLHFYECSTIIEMKKNNKFQGKYVNSNNSYNGKYKIKLSEDSETKEQLTVCGNCIDNSKRDLLLTKELLQDKYGNYITKNNLSDFSLNKFFDFYGYYSFIKGLECYSKLIIPSNKYPENWSEISKHERQKVNYICQECGWDAKGNEYFLDVDHIDQNKGNNFSDNFRILCKICHGSLPNHSHYKKELMKNGDWQKLKEIKK